MGFLDRLQHGWNAFVSNRDPTRYVDSGPSTYYRPDRVRLSRGNDRTIVTAVYNRIALDVAAINIKHIKLDDNKRYTEDIDSALNNCLTLEANIDQTARSFRQDVVMSMFDEGVVAIVPVDTTDDATITGAFDVNSMRTGKVIQWKPTMVQVRVYNDMTGQKEDIWLPKKAVSIVENPFYAVMNEANSTVKRLQRKLVLMDLVDEKTGADKLDLLIQLPYAIKSPTRKAEAEDRRKQIEEQLTNSRLGIAYIDGTEHVTQLNRSLENNLLKQIESLQELLYSQLGITKEIMEGTADEKTMTNYNNRTIEPVISAIVDELKRKFLTKTARTRGQDIAFFKDPFKLVPVTALPDLADKFTRNEIMSSNEWRQIIGLIPSKDTSADELRNKNINQSAETPTDTTGSSGATGNPTDSVDAKEKIFDEILAGLESDIDGIIGGYS